MLNAILNLFKKKSKPILERRGVIEPTHKTSPVKNEFSRRKTDRIERHHTLNSDFSIERRTDVNAHNILFTSAWIDTSTESTCDTSSCSDSSSGSSGDSCGGD